MPAGDLTCTATFSPASTFVPFETFTLDRLTMRRQINSLYLLSSFTLGPESNGISPAAEPLTLVIANSSFLVPAGAFREGGQPGTYYYVGSINGASIVAVIAPSGSNRFMFRAWVTGAKLKGAKHHRIAVELIIGNDRGTAWVKPSIRAQ